MPEHAFIIKSVSVGNNREEPTAFQPDTHPQPCSVKTCSMRRTPQGLAWQSPTCTRQRVDEPQAARPRFTGTEGPRGAGGTRAAPSCPAGFPTARSGLGDSSWAGRVVSLAHTPAHLTLREAAGKLVKSRPSRPRRVSGPAAEMGSALMLATEPGLGRTALSAPKAR